MPAGLSSNVTDNTDKERDMITNRIKNASRSFVDDNNVVDNTDKERDTITNRVRKTSNFVISPKMTSLPQLACSVVIHCVFCFIDLKKKIVR